MKTMGIALPMLLLVCTIGSMIPQDIPLKEMTHEFIVPFPGVRKEKIFERVVKWLENNLRSPRPVIEKEDEEAGTIAGNGVTELRAEGDSADVRLAFIITSDVRDGKARFRFINLEIFAGPENGWETMPQDTTWHRPAQKKFSAIVTKLTEYVNRHLE